MRKCAKFCVFDKISRKCCTYRTTFSVFNEISRKLILNHQKNAFGLNVRENNQIMYSRFKFVARIQFFCENNKFYFTALHIWSCVAHILENKYFRENCLKEGHILLTSFAFFLRNFRKSQLFKILLNFAKIFWRNFSSFSHNSGSKFSRTFANDFSGNFRKIAKTKFFVPTLCQKGSSFVSNPLSWLHLPNNLF